MSKKNTKVKGAIFDLDGTIIEQSRESVHQALTKFLQERGYDVLHIKREDYKESLVEVLEFYVPSERISELNRDFWDYFGRLDSDPQLIAGASAALKRCNQMGIECHIATGRTAPPSSVWKVLGDLKIDCFFKSVNTRRISSLEEEKDFQVRSILSTSKVSPSEFVFVSDSPRDLLSGRRHGIEASIGVLTGMHERQSFQRIPGIRILESVAKVPDDLLI
jgi:phosphoglycolate phosphatase-like HAD superfamily hydrolase